MKEYKHPGNEKNFYKGFTYTFKKEVVEQVLNGLMSQRYAAEKYGISRNTVASWCKQFNPDMGSKNHPKYKEIKKLKKRVEEHLRQLCVANGLSVESIKSGKPIPKKADLINAELATAGVYGKLDQKSVTSWLDLRNKAAHGKYNEYTKEQVDLMIQGVSNFMVRNQV